MCNGKSHLLLTITFHFFIVSNMTKIMNLKVKYKCNHILHPNTTSPCACEIELKGYNLNGTSNVSITPPIQGSRSAAK
jgi:hypothetical protein